MRRHEIEVCSQSNDNGAALRLDPVRVAVAQTRITVAELIKRTVEAQVRDLAISRRLSAPVIRHTLDSQYATEHHDLPAWGRINTRAEVRNAFNAFKMGVFMVVVNGDRVPSHLFAHIDVPPGSCVTFVRLQPLIN